MKKMVVASLAVAFLLMVSWPMAQAFQLHPKPHKVKKHRTKGSRRHHLFF